MYIYMLMVSAPPPNPNPNPNPPGCAVWFPRPGGPNSTDSSKGAGPLKPVMLFDVEEDPEERAEVSADHPAVVDFLLGRLHHHQKTALPVVFPEEDPRCDPGPSGAWGPWA